MTPFKFNTHFLKIFIITSILLFYQTSISQHKRIDPFHFKRNYDTQHIKLVIDIDEQQKSISGNAIVTIVPLTDSCDYCIFHSKKIDITNITINDSISAKASTDSETVCIEFPRYFSTHDTLNIKIEYRTTPVKGVYFNGPTENDPSTPHQIYSHSEPIDARYWFPCYDRPDDKLTSEIIVKVDSQYTVLSNGELLSQKYDQNSNKYIFHWYQNKPHVTYLISFVAGEYQILTDNTQTVPIQYYVYKNDIESGKLTFAKTPSIFAFFSDKFQYEYPWNKYAQVIIRNYKARGMEHTSATSLIDNSIYDRTTLLDINSDDLITHELAHQWFGDLVTCNDWSHIWLNEGFATYAEILFCEYDQGFDAAQYEVILQQNYYIALEDSNFYQPIVFDNYFHPEELFNHIAYDKASMVLHMLRNTIGDNNFFESISNYLHQYAFQTVDTDNFITTVNNTTNADLDWFFEQWLYHGGYPQLKVNYDWSADLNMLTLKVEQLQVDSTQNIPVFKLPVEIEIATKHKNYIKKIEITKQSESFNFQIDSEPLMLIFDKNNVILKSIDFPKSQSECLYQLKHDDHIYGRLFVIEQLKKNTIDTATVIQALENTLFKDPFWAVRKKAAYALEKFMNDDVNAILIKGCEDVHSKVRASCIQILGDLYDPQLYSHFENIANSDSSYWVITEALYAITKIPDSLNFDFLSNFIEMNSYNDMIQTAAFEGLRELKDKRGIPIAIKYAGNTQLPFSRRYSALKLLEEIAIDDNETEQFLIQFLNTNDDDLLNKTLQILSKFSTISALSAIKEYEKRNLSDSVRRRVEYARKKIESSLILKK